MSGSNLHSEIKVTDDSTVFVGAGLLKSIGQQIKGKVKASKFVIITDENVAALHLANLKRSLGLASIAPLVYVCPPGEPTKNRQEKERIEDWMLENHCQRDTCVIALGGGVIGDLSGPGFVASTFLRGVPVVQIPTTVMSMLDSSVGGKTAVDVPAGKNLIGAFYQPTMIFADLDLLATLPERQLINGLAEAIKMGMIRDAKLFDFLEANVKKVLARDSESMKYVVRRCIELKAEVVAEDEKEAGLRSILNFGHTIGHAIEAITYETDLHGECVSIGMKLEGEIARDLGKLTTEHLTRLIKVIKAYKLPVDYPTNCDIDTVMNNMLQDKKNIGGQIRMTIITNVGECISLPQAVDGNFVRLTMHPNGCVIPPTAPVYGTMPVPGSKSISNRALLLAALANGSCKMKGLLQSEDTVIMMTCLRKMGVGFEWTGANRDVLLINGTGGKLTACPDELYVSNAGTAARFLTTALTIVQPHGGVDSMVLTGNDRMNTGRPIHDLVTALTSCGCQVECLKKQGYTPIRVKSNGAFPGGKIEIAADTSSQFVTSLMLTAPLSKQETILELKGTITSRPYIDMTIRMMESFGVKVTEPTPGVFHIPPKPYTNPAEYQVEPDSSTATYPFLIAAATGGKVSVPGLPAKPELSLQGDTQFAWLLERMGCTVSHGDGKLTVQGPANGTAGLTGVDVDMNTMTDAFLGLCCLAAVSKGTTRITNISNQRVKECNRILAMVTELTKCGVPAKELETGIEVTGIDKSTVKPARIHCYNDHRVAMSFACLGMAVPGIVIEDKHCVEKTYPEFWAHCFNYLKVQFDTSSPAMKLGAEKPDDTADAIILVGMRGAGKTTLGKVASKALGWKFLDMDQLFEDEHGPIRAYNRGWPEFRKEELKVLRRVLAGDFSQPGEKLVISCGGGIVETGDAVELLKKNQTKVPVIWIEKDIDVIVKHLAQDDSRPDLDVGTKEAYERRLPIYQEVSTFHFPLPAIGGLKEDFYYNMVNKLFARLCRVAARQPLRTPLDFPNTFFLSLCVPTIASLTDATLTKVMEKTDVIELRADMLQGKSVKDHAKAITELSARMGSVPILYTLRTSVEGGQFSGSEDDAFKFYEQALRLGVEMIDVEAQWDRSRLEAFVKKARSRGVKVIVSKHDFQKMPTDSVMEDFFRTWTIRADVAKLVARPSTLDDCHNMIRLSNEYRKRGVTIGLCLGSLGKVTRVMNPVLTPVCHPGLDCVAAPGQMSVDEIMSCRKAMELYATDAKAFYIFGSPVSMSASPTMHNPAFKANGLAYKYLRFDSSDVDDMMHMVNCHSCGGGSVTIPLKEEVLKQLPKASVSESARAIGAVNTLVKKDGVVEGTNTDWAGFKGILEYARKLHPLNRPKRTALVLGAGGTGRAAVYACQQAGFEQVLVWNRSFERVKKLCEELPGAQNCSSITGIDTPVDAIINTLPGDASLPEEPAIRKILTTYHSIVIESSYRSSTTSTRNDSLLTIGKELHCCIAEGLDLLYEQGVCQSNLFCDGKPAPRDVMAQALVKERFPNTAWRDLPIMLKSHVEKPKDEM